MLSQWEKRELEIFNLKTNNYCHYREYRCHLHLFRIVLFHRFDNLHFTLVFSLAFSIAHPYMQKSWFHHAGGKGQSCEPCGRQDRQDSSLPCEYQLSEKTGMGLFLSVTCACFIFHVEINFPPVVLTIHYVLLGRLIIPSFY